MVYAFSSNPAVCQNKESYAIGESRAISKLAVPDEVINSFVLYITP
jgi:hypothetical protein